jgi:glycosyltransferase 2 family protein
MSSITKPKLSKSVFIVSVIGLVVFILYLYYYVGISGFISSLEKLNLWYYSFAFVLVVASVFFHSIVWRGLLDHLCCRISIRTAFWFGWIGIFVDNVVPGGVTGDLFKAYWLCKTEAHDTGKVVASVIAHKILIIMILLVNTVVGLVLWLLGYRIVDSAVFGIIVGISLVLVFTLVMIFYLSNNRRVTGKLLDGIIRLIIFLRRNKWDSVGFRSKMEKTLFDFHSGIITLKTNPRGLLWPIVFSVLAWFADLVVFILCFMALGYELPAYQALIAYALTATLLVEGVSFLGFNEIIKSSLFIALGIPSAIGVTSILLNRFATFWFRLIVSYGVFHWKILAPYALRQSSPAIDSALTTNIKPVINRNKKGIIS